MSTEKPSSSKAKGPSEEQKESALVQLTAGVSVTDISTKLGLSKALVTRWKKEHMGEDSVQVNRRPTAEDNAELIRLAKVYPKYQLKELMEMADYPASEATAKKRLKEAKVTLKKKPAKKTKSRGKKQWCLPTPEELAGAEWLKNRKKENRRHKREYLKKFIAEEEAKKKQNKILIVPKKSQKN